MAFVDSAFSLSIVLGLLRSRFKVGTASLESNIYNPGQPSPRRDVIEGLRYILKSSPCLEHSGCSNITWMACASSLQFWVLQCYAHKHGM